MAFGAVETLLNAYAGSSGSSVSISDMSYNGNRTVFYPVDPPDDYTTRGDIVRITGTGEIQAYLINRQPPLPNATFRLTVAGKHFDVQYMLPAGIYDSGDDTCDTAVIPFWFQFLITYTTVVISLDIHTVHFEVNGVVALANDIVPDLPDGNNTKYKVNWSIGPGDDGGISPVLDSRNYYEADVSAFLDPNALNQGEIVVVEFDQATIEYLWSPTQDNSSS